MKRLLIPLFSIALWWSAAAQDKAQSDGGWWNENPSLVLPIRACLLYTSDAADE